MHSTKNIPYEKLWAALGKPLRSPEVLNLLRLLEPHFGCDAQTLIASVESSLSNFKETSMPFEHGIGFDELGLLISFQLPHGVPSLPENKLALYAHVIFIHPQWEGPLPKGLTFKDARENIHAKLGVPHERVERYTEIWNDKEKSLAVMFNAGSASIDHIQFEMS